MKLPSSGRMAGGSIFDKGKDFFTTVLHKPVLKLPSILFDFAWWIFYLKWSDQSEKFDSHLSVVL